MTTMAGVPQMSLLSENQCPNATDDYIAPGSPSCLPLALTTYGYCLWCWENGKVPAVWRARVAEAVEIEITHRERIHESD